MTQLARLQSTLASSDFDAILVSSQINQRYLSDFDCSDSYMLIGMDKAYLLTDSRYIEAAQATICDFETLCPQCRLSDAVSELIAENGYERIAFEEASMPYDSLALFRTSLTENAQLLAGASKMLSVQRSVKLPYEIERMTRAQELTDRAFEHILQVLSSDTTITERDVALELEFFMRKNGAEATAFDTIAVSGSSSSLPHGVPSDTVLRFGFLTMDFGARYKGYCSDMTRTVVIGRADAEMKKVYNTVLSAQTAALDVIKAGMLCRDADAVARNIITDAGYGNAFGHSLGHGVGAFIHESPNLSPRAYDNSRLEIGNVVTVEPGIYLNGRFGCRIEDMITVLSDGSIYNFTKSPKYLIEI